MLNNLMYLNSYIIARIRRIYFMALPEGKSDLKKSRVCYTVGDTSVQTIAQLAGGTFLATLMSYCGISDANIGIITSLVSFAAIIQIFLINYFKRLKKFKFLVCFTALQRILFAFIYFIPLLSIGNSMKAALIVILYLAGQIFVQIGTPASQDWIASLVPSRLRGKYFTIKDSIAVFVVSSSMLICGIILDFFEARNLKTGFLLIGIIIFLLAMINFIAFSKMKEPRLSYINTEGKEMHGRLAKKAKEKEKAEKGHEKSILAEIKEAFQDRKFRKAFNLQTIYIFAYYISLPFNSSYQINELALPYTFMMVVIFVCNLYRIYIAPKLGRLADKYGMGRALRFSLLVLGLNMLSNALTVPGNAYPLYIISNIISSTAWAFVGVGLFGVQLDFFVNEKRMVWLTLVSSISGLLGFLVSVIGGKMLDMLQKADIHLWGIKIYAQQVLNMIGFLIILIAVWYIRFYIETEKVNMNHKDGTINV